MNVNDTMVLVMHSLIDISGWFNNKKSTAEICKGQHVSVWNADKNSSCDYTTSLNSRILRFFRSTPGYSNHGSTDRVTAARLRGILLGWTKSLWFTLDSIALQLDGLNEISKL